MKRDFLTELGLDSEKIDQIMAEHGKTINTMKNDLDKVKDFEDQVKTYQDQLKERDTQLEELSKKAKGNEDLTNQIQELQTKNQQAIEEYQNKLNQQAFDFALERQLAGAKAKNPKAVRALLDVDSIKMDGDKLLGLDDQLKGLRESDAYLFGEMQKNVGQPSNPPGGGGNDPTNFRESSPEAFQNEAAKYGLRF